MGKTKTLLFAQEAVRGLAVLIVCFTPLQIIALDTNTPTEPTSNKAPLTGIRVNGLNGYSEKELETDKSSLGLRRVFSRPHVFEGTAPLGATVELLLNDISIEVQQVFPEENSPLGVGNYRFEDVELPSGILNEIVIIITKANGNEVRIEKSIIGTLPLPPNEPSAHLSMLGSRSDSNTAVSEPNLPIADPNIVVPDHDLSPPEPNTPAPDPNTTVSEPNPSTSDPNAAVFEPNLPAADPNIVAPDHDISPPEPNTPAPDPNEQTPDPNAIVPEPNLTTSDPNTTVSEPNLLAADPNIVVPNQDISSPKPNTPAPDPNTTVSEPNPSTSDPNAAVFEPNLPAADPNIAIPDQDISTPEPNTPASASNTQTPEPNTTIEEPNTYYFEQFIDTGSTEDATGRTIELVGFVVRGRRLSEKLTIEDLDSIVTPDGKRLLPLLRILRAFKVTISEDGNLIKFTPEGAEPVTIDFLKRQIQIKDQTRPLSCIEATSEITMKPDMYISPEDLSEILDMELEWDNALYEYRIQLDRQLSIWKRIRGKSLFGIGTQFISSDLPEELPPAESSDELLHFLEFNWSPRYDWKSNSSVSSYSHSIRSSSPHETLLGKFKKGRYKLQVSHPELVWEDNERGYYWRNDDKHIAQLNWFEWSYRLPTAEVALGDSSFGIGELVFPGSRITGIRVNGLNGYSLEELETDKSSLGLRRVFSKPYIFEGTAPLGATVELLLNDISIEVQEVFPEEDSPPGIGTYRFEDIELPSGILNEIVIVITEANGNEVRVEKSIIGTPTLLPKGRSAYLGVLGSRREIIGGEKKNFETGNFSGQFAAARLLYGLSDRLTIGGMLGLQQDYFQRSNEQASQSDRRRHPKSSTHVGGLFSYLPFDKLFLSGEFATSQGEGTDSYNDMGLRMRAEYLPTKKLSLQTDFLYFGADYFNGQSSNIYDRMGGELGISWKLWKKWSLEAGAGQIQNNLDGSLNETLTVDYQNIGLRTTILPHSTLDFRFNRLGSNLESDQKILSELRLRTSPYRGLNIYGRISSGNKIDLGDYNGFFTGLRLKNAPRSTRPSQYWTLRKSLSKANTIGFGYSDTGLEKSISFTHDLNIRIKDHPLRSRTEILHDLMTDGRNGKLRFRNRTEYLLDRVGYNRIGFTGEYQDGEYQAMFYLSIRNLYAKHRNLFTNINEHRVRTAYGAVHGRVFLDYNGNYLLDKGEPGVPDVTVGLNGIKSAITDDNGYYILPGLGNGPNARVHLDIDTVPAIYSVTHGTQIANITRESLTEVNLSVAPLISIIGRITATYPDGQTRSVSGVRVYLSDANTKRFAADSFTADDGTYYLGDIKPGEYILKIDMDTVPPNHQISEQERNIKVVSTKDDFQEIEMPDFTASVTPQ